MYRSLLFGLALVAGGWVPIVLAGETKPEQGIDPVGMKAKVSYLAADERLGRAAGSAQGHVAALWLADQAAAIGLQPIGEPDPSNAKLAYLQPFEVEGRACRNVVALLPATGAGASDEYVIVGAHYDHLGRGQRGSLAWRSTAVHNGADDNASGCAALLEVAEGLVARRAELKRSVVFVWFDAEELGLRGAMHYGANPLLPLERCVAMINLDMVGRSRDHSVTAFGTTSGLGLSEHVHAQAGAAGLRVNIVPYMLPNSDHFAFYKRGIPVTFLTTGLHADYHRPTDDADKVNYGDLVRIATLTQEVVLAVGGDLAPVAFAKVPAPPLGYLALDALLGLSGVAWVERVREMRYGPVHGAWVVPEAATGLSVVYVATGSVLAKAGLQVGDTLVGASGGLLGPDELALGDWQARGRLKMALARASGGVLLLAPRARLRLTRQGKELQISVGTP